MTDCLFCRIINKEIPAAIVHEDDDIIAIRDISPKAPTHILIISKKHIEGLYDMEEEDVVLIGRMNYLARLISEQEDIAQSGYRLITNSRVDSGQEIAHIHYHLLGGRFLGDFCEHD